MAVLKACTEAQLTGVYVPCPSIWTTEYVIVRTFGKMRRHVESVFDTCYTIRVGPSSVDKVLWCGSEVEGRGG